jgi:hypothetical protein
MSEQILQLNPRGWGEDLFLQYGAGALAAHLADDLAGNAHHVVVVEEAGPEIVDHRSPGRNGDLLDLAVELVPEPNDVGEALGTAFGGVAMIGRVALLIGEAGNAALTVYNIVEDPLSVPFAILGLVVSPFSVTGRSSRGVVFKEACRFPGDVEGCGLEEVWG